MYASPRKRQSQTPPPPPAKTIDLNSSTRSTDPQTGAKTTKRAFHCDLIVKSDGQGGQTARQPLLTTATTQLLEAMGTSLDPVPGNIEAAAAPSEQDDAAKLPALVEELIKTEKSYISRIRALKLVRNTV
jgi:hypothetical protein